MALPRCGANSCLFLYSGCMLFVEEGKGKGGFKMAAFSH